MKDWRVEEATPDQRAQLLSMEENLFGASSVVRARWLLEANPAGKATVLVALTPDGEIAGTRSLFPWKLLVDGKETVTGQTSRAWTLPEFRRQGVSIAIGRELKTRSAALGYPVVFVFPSDRSIPGHRILDNSLDVLLERRQILTSLRFFWSKSPEFLDAALRWGRLLPGNRSPRFQEEWKTEEHPDRVGEELPRPEAAVGVWGVRDAAFVRWRFGRESGRRYDAWRYPASGPPRLVAFSHTVGNRVRIVDLWGSLDPSEMIPAVRGLTEVLGRGTVCLVEWCPPRFGGWPRVAAGAGLFSRRQGVPLARWFPAPGGESGTLHSISNYHLTEGDSDYA